MSLGIWILRERARPLAERLADRLGGVIETASAGKNREAFREVFSSRRQWVIVGASGVATRYLSGLLESKVGDPAVVVLDEAARYAISLVGGHEGGANALAYAVADVTAATPVVTTATEALKPLVVGIGCRRGATSEQIDAAVTAALPNGREISEIREIATVDLKAGERGLVEWAAGLGLPIRVIEGKQIATRPWVTQPSEWVQEQIGLPGVCEPAALIACPRGAMIVPKCSLDGVSVAIVEDRTEPWPGTDSREVIQDGRLALVSLGPGDRSLIPPKARAAIAAASDVVGYGLYLDLIEPWLAGKTSHRMPLTQERERADLAIELAREGRSVALVSSGDIGIYGMATLVFELLDEVKEEGGALDVELIPGITAATSSAALLGAPLAHDFATLSLSDLLCPWEWIESRARAIAESDLAVALYNVQSRSRPDGVKRVLDLLMESKPPETVCGVVRAAWRAGQEVTICTLRELRQMEFDMLTTVIVGNRFTRKNAFGIFSPRGYLEWQGQTCNPEVPSGAIWVFAGTHDGNQIAQALRQEGLPIVVSVATEYGKDVARQTLVGDITVINGAVGSEKRRQLLESARAVVDATHPFAVKISEDLAATTAAMGVPYLRYERPAEPIAYEQVQIVADFDTALTRAISVGSRIFLATGAKELGLLGASPHSENVQWFARFAPDPDSLQMAIASGLPRSHICLMQGPFSVELNVAQWRDWGIDCLVTRDSGSGSGMKEKLEAAKQLGIPAVVIGRPPVPGVHVVDDPGAVANWARQIENAH